MPTIKEERMTEFLQTTNLTVKNTFEKEKLEKFENKFFFKQKEES